MRRPALLALVALSTLVTLSTLTWPARAGAQAQSCYGLGPTALFCGKQAGWKPAPIPAEPGSFSFENQEFIFAISVQANHGQSISHALFDLAIDGVLQGMDLRTDHPPGTHRAALTEVIRHDMIEGRRIHVPSVLDAIESHFIVDIYFSSRHAWTTQTGHLGPITPERLVRVHDLAMQEVRLDP